MQSANLTRLCLSVITHKLDTPVAFVAPFLSFYFLRGPISDGKTCGIHTCVPLELRIVGMAVDKRRIVNMLYVTVDLLAGRRLEGFRGNT